MSREIDAPAQPDYQGEVLVVPVMEERLVLQKRLVLVASGEDMASKRDRHRIVSSAWIARG